MKAKLFFLALLLPLLASAQENIMRAWKNFSSQSFVTIDSEKHSIEKDPATNKKTDHLEYWIFSVPKDKFSYIEHLSQAFDKDADRAYSINEGITSQTNEMQFAVGTVTQGSVYFGSKKGSHYKYCLFLDPEDADGRCRYSYSLDWIKSGDNYTGMFMITYATTLKYRQEQERQSKDIGDSDDSWFSKFISLASTIEGANPASRKFLAGKIFELTKASNIPQEDKETAIDFLNTTILTVGNHLNDKATVSILRGCVKNLEQ